MHLIPGLLHGVTVAPQGVAMRGGALLRLRAYAGRDGPLLEHVAGGHGRPCGVRETLAARQGMSDGL